MTPPPTPELSGKVILITGASRGVGRAVACAAAAAGATVLVAARDVTALEHLSDEIEAGGGPPPIIVPLNLEAATVDDYALVVAHIGAQFGRLDGLVANAAMLGELAPVASYDAVTWARVFQVNLHSVFLLLQAALPLLVLADDASVIFSLADEGVNAKAHWGAYAASKFALRGLLGVLAAEFGSSKTVRVNGVLLPPLRTRLRLTAFPATDPRTLPDPITVTPAFIRLLGRRGAGLNGRIVNAADGSLAP